MIKKYLKRTGYILLSATLIASIQFSGFAGTDPECKSCAQSSIGSPSDNGGSKPISDEEFSKMNKEIKEKKYTFKIGKNSATKYSIKQLCGFNPTVSEKAPLPAIKADSLVALPSVWDWRQKNGVTSVKNQGNCGSCWTFGTCGAMESAIKVKTGTEVDLSEQYLLSCNTDGYSCQGGWWEHKMHQSQGAVLERDFPYVQQKVPCRTVPHSYKIDGWGYVGSQMSVPSVDAIKQAIYTYGSVAAAVAADDYFNSYRSGVFNRNDPYAQINHAILLVGWDDTKRAWILKNSWGAGWGENGYMYIGYNVNKVGYNATYVVYNGGVNPTVSPTTNPWPTPTPSGNKTPTPTSSKTPTPNPSNTWKVNTYYTAGTLVTYNGVTYQCIISHTSYYGWEPPNTPALWAIV